MDEGEREREEGRRERKRIGEGGGGPFPPTGWGSEILYNNSGGHRFHVRFGMNVCFTKLSKSVLQTFKANIAL